MRNKSAFNFLVKFLMCRIVLIEDDKMNYIFLESMKICITLPPLKAYKQNFQCWISITILL